VLAGSAAQTNTVRAAATPAPWSGAGFYRMRVGDLEVDGSTRRSAVFDLHWLTARKVVMDGVERALREDPHLLDVGRHPASWSTPASN